MYLKQAVLELGDVFQLSDHINIVCLPPPDSIPNQKGCFAGGWGEFN